MLPRSRRMTKSSFRHTPAGRSFFSDYFTLRVIPSSAGEMRIAAIVSKKVASTAVKRNALRRKIYEALRPRLSDMKPQRWYLWYPKAPALLLSFAQIQKEVAILLHSAGVIGSDTSPKV